MKKTPPWGNNVAASITDLSYYFVTSDGEDFLTRFEHVLNKAKDINEAILIDRF